MADNVAKGSVVVGAETSKLTEGLKDAQKQIAGFNTQITKSVSFFGTGKAGGIAAGMSLAVAAAKALVTEITEIGSAAERTMNSAATFGVSTKQFQEIEQSAKLAGVEINDIEKAYQQMANTIVGSQLGDQDALSKLRLLGLGPKDFDKKTVVASFDLIAGAIGKIEDPMVKAKLASEIFGKSALKLMPILNGNAAAARAMQSEIGAVIPGSTLQAFNDASSQVEQLGQAFQGLKTRALEPAANFVTRGARFYTSLIADINAATFGPDNTGPLKPGEKGRAKGGWDAIAAQRAETEAKLGLQLSQQQGDDYDKWVKDVTVSGKDLETQAQTMLKTWEMEASAAKVYALELKGLNGEQLAAAKSAAFLMDNMALAKSLVQDHPWKGVERQAFALTQIGLDEEKQLTGFGALAQSIIGKAGLGGAPRSVSAMVAGSNEDIRARIQNQMDSQAASPADQLQAAMKELSRKYDAQIQLGRESRDFLEKIARKDPIAVDAR